MGVPAHDNFAGAAFHNLNQKCDTTVVDHSFDESALQSIDKQADREPFFWLNLHPADEPLKTEYRHIYAESIKYIPVDGTPLKLPKRIIADIMEDVKDLSPDDVPADLYALIGSFLDD